jgi:hypothetical protein
MAGVKEMLAEDLMKDFAKGLMMMLPYFSVAKRPFKCARRARCMFVFNLG